MNLGAVFVSGAVPEPLTKRVVRVCGMYRGRSAARCRLMSAISDGSKGGATGWRTSHATRTTGALGYTSREALMHAIYPHGNQNSNQDTTCGPSVRSYPRRRTGIGPESGIGRLTTRP